MSKKYISVGTALLIANLFTMQVNAEENSESTGLIAVDETSSQDTSSTTTIEESNIVSPTTEEAKSEEESSAIATINESNNVSPTAEETKSEIESSTLAEVEETETLAVTDESNNELSYAKTKYPEYETTIDSEGREYIVQKDGYVQPTVTETVTEEEKNGVTYTTVTTKTSCQADLNASAVIDMNLDDPSNNGFFEKVPHGEYPSYLALQHWQEGQTNETTRKQNWRPLFTTEVGIQNAQMRVTLPYTDVTVSDATQWAITRYLPATEPEGTNHPYQTAISYINYYIENGEIVFELGDVPAYSAFSIVLTKDFGQPTDLSNNLYIGAIRITGKWNEEDADLYEWGENIKPCETTTVTTTPMIPLVPVDTNEEEPEIPVDPEEPETPVDPGEPETPVDPEKPETPVNPEEPENTEKSENSNNPGEQVQSKTATVEASSKDKIPNKNLVTEDSNVESKPAEQTVEKETLPDTAGSAWILALLGLSSIGVGAGIGFFKKQNK